MKSVLPENRFHERIKTLYVFQVQRKKIKVGSKPFITVEPGDCVRLG